MSEISPQHQQENRAFLSLLKFARRRPRYASDPEALTHIVTSFHELVHPATECIARLRPDLAEASWNDVDNRGLVVDSRSEKGPLAYEMWQLRHEIPEKSRNRISLEVGGVYGSGLVKLSVYPPEAGLLTHLMTMRYEHGITRNIGFLVTSARVEVGAGVRKRKELGLDLFQLNLLKDELVVPLSSNASDFADLAAARAFSQADYYGLAHHQLWRCAVDICRVVTADHSIGEIGSWYGPDL